MSTELNKNVDHVNNGDNDDDSMPEAETNTVWHRQNSILGCKSCGSETSRVKHNIRSRVSCCDGADTDTDSVSERVDTHTNGDGIEILRDTSTSCYDNPPDGGWGWVVTFSSFMISFILDGISFSFGIFFSALLDHFQANKGLTSSISSVLNGTYLGIGPLASILVKAYGGRKVGVLGGVLAALGFFFCTWAPSVHIMIVLYGFVGGVGLGFIYLPAIVTVGHYFQKKRALATGIAVCGSGIGSFVFAPLCQLLIEEYTWKGAMLILSAIVLNCVPFALLLRPLEETVRLNEGRRKNKLAKSNCEKEKMLLNENIEKDSGNELAKIFDFGLLKSPTFLLYGLSSFLATAGFFIPFVFLPGQVIKLGMSVRQSAMLLSVIGIFNTVTRIVVGWASDRPWADANIINVVALIVGGAVTMVVPFFSHISLLLVFCGLFGYSIAVFVSLRSIIMAELLGVERLTSSFGLVTLCQGIAAYIGSPVAGVLSDMTGDYNGAFYLSGLTIALAGLICIPLRRLSRWENEKSNLKLIRQATV